MAVHARACHASSWDFGFDFVGIAVLVLLGGRSGACVALPGGLPPHRQDEVRAAAALCNGARLLRTGSVQLSSGRKEGGC
jgi:hypothetical protein